MRRVNCPALGLAANHEGAGDLAGCGKIVLSERFLPSLCRFVSLESLFARISCCRRPACAFQGRAQTLRPGLTAPEAAIRFRMRTRL